MISFSMNIWMWIYRCWIDDCICWCADGLTLKRKRRTCEMIWSKMLEPVMSKKYWLIMLEHVKLSDLTTSFRELISSRTWSYLENCLSWVSVVTCVHSFCMSVFFRKRAYINIAEISVTPSLYNNALPSPEEAPIQSSLAHCSQLIPRSTHLASLYHHRTHALAGTH